MDQDPQIPDSLRDALKSRFPAVNVPVEVDQTVLRGARSYLRRNKYLRYAAIAAGLVLAGTVLTHLMPQQAESLTMDVNHDREVNILDALTLARRGDAAGQDVEAIAVASVRIGGTR